MVDITYKNGVVTARLYGEIDHHIAPRIRGDIDAIMERDPAARSRGEVLCLYSGLHALMLYRVAHALHVREHYFPARLISQSAKFLTGIEIHPGATIGRGLFIDHGSGVVIGETAIVGDNCTLYQGVTLGGTGKDTGKRHPTLGNNVNVGSGAKVLGPVTIGDNTKIAANAVVLTDIPADCTVVGIPGQIVKKDGMRVKGTHSLSAVSSEVADLQKKIEALEQIIDFYERSQGSDAPSLKEISANSFYNPSLDNMGYVETEQKK
jgi:serine O-acetyltransferase